MSQTKDYLGSDAVSREGPDTGLLVNLIIQDAVTAEASDIHIEAWEHELVVRLRLNGVLTPLISLPSEWHERIAGRVKVMANLVSYQTGLPQEGHAKAEDPIGHVELRISVFPTVRGEKIVIRMFDSSSRHFELQDLGFEKEALERFQGLLHRPSGLILLTGPTGSGKTTVIYSALCHLVSQRGTSISISTVEDPVEFRLPMISQAQIHPARDFTYPVALRSLMRQDPEVIMVGEIRDVETAEIAVQAGLTGHLVLSTMHSDTTAGIFARLMNMGIEPFLLASSIIGALGLRLIRLNCTFCSAPYQPAAPLLEYLTDLDLDDISFRHGQGCEHCVHTGFRNRTAITEILQVDENIRETVLTKPTSRQLQKTACENGMKTLWDAGLARVKNGETPFEEILRVVTVEDHYSKRSS